MGYGCELKTMNRPQHSITPFFHLRRRFPLADVDFPAFRLR